MVIRLLKNLTVSSILLGAILVVLPIRNANAQCFCYDKRPSTGACDVPSLDCVCCKVFT